jgi:Family of unknown function (DUF6058)
MPERRLTTDDIAYIEANYSTLEALCAGRRESPADVEASIASRRLPGPSYVLDDGTPMFPADYFRLVDEAGGVEKLPAHFAARHRQAVNTERARTNELERDWQAYLDGTYGVCLRQVTPETIVRKSALVSSLCELLMLPRARDPEWRRALRAHVDELDALEGDFAPDYDRGDAQDRPPTRDLLIVAARERYPDVFDDEHASADSSALTV